jgi:glycosyltransferase involved in cell wall biosynthesis
MTKLIGMCGVFRQHQLASGAYSFFENLLRGLAAVQSFDAAADFRLVVFHGAQPIRWGDPRVTYKQLPDRYGRYPVEARVGLRESARMHAMLFPNSFTPPIVRSKRVVTVIHDLQYLHMPEYWPLGKRLWMRACHFVTLRKCDAVVAISQAVKDDILRQYGERWAPRVHAIWNPVSLERFDQPAEQRFSGGRPYILCTAVDRPAKNLSTLIRAFALVREQLPEHCLVLAGQLRSADRTWRVRREELEAKMPSAVDLVEQLGLANHVITTGFVPDAQLGALYRGASVFVLPSLFEGFGMPAVESIALGAPTLATGLPVLREVTLGRARYIENPLDEHEMAERIVDILKEGEAARPSRELQCEIRRRFAPETIAQEYLRLLLGEG